MTRKTYVPFGRISEFIKTAGDSAELYLMKPGPRLFSDYEMIRFATRKALEAFNKRAGLRPLVYTIVPTRNHIVYAHQKAAS